MLFLGRGLDVHRKLGSHCSWQHYNLCPIKYDIIRCGYWYSCDFEYPCNKIYRQKMEEKIKNEK